VGKETAKIVKRCFTQFRTTAYCLALKGQRYIINPDQQGKSLEVRNVGI